MHIEYEKVGELLALKGIESVASELHGMICGQLCSGSLPYSSELTGKLLDEGNNELETVLEELFKGLADETLTHLSSHDFGFQPLLPDDDEELSLRIYALGRWCDGFNLGFAAGYSASGQVIKDDVREVLGDFARIAEIEVNDYEEQEEGDYMEVVEYLRVATTSLFLQHEPKDGSGPKENEPAIH